MLLTSNHEPKADRVDAFATLADFKLAVINAVAQFDERALYELFEHFAVDDQGARRISNYREVF